MPDDEAASRGGWQVRSEPWDLLVPPPEQPLVQLSTQASSFSHGSQREQQKPNCRVTVLHQVLSHLTKLLQ